ncbi:PREDICTED: eukaryotic translation initiation factor 1-like [Odobenus rosmarus divergens]|uniref:Eukaryotic translation initiation factor 1-like n=1 Tax=Odobenus rosmarus divergens TaxID=9708 RepID=A0A9B0HFW5_ODORO
MVEQPSFLLTAFGSCVLPAVITTPPLRAAQTGMIIPYYLRKSQRFRDQWTDQGPRAVSTEEKESYHTFAIQNLHSFDPFADASKGDDLLPAGTEDYIHIRIQQRNGRKTLTTVQGIADDYDKKKLVKAFKKKFACNGTVIEHPEYGEVIQLQGDQRKNICQFLVEIGLAKDDQLKVHGF